MKTILKYILSLLALVSVAVPAYAQEPLYYTDFARNGLDWYTVETEHFLVHFHSDETGKGSRTARVVARIAEDVYGPITDLYDLRPDTKVSFVLKDFEDYSNGAAYFFDNVIEIWAPALNTPFRGDHNWLRNVITHEFTHMIQVQKTMKASRHLPFMYLQYLDYEEVSRPDVLYGFPNVLASYPLPVLNNPAWLAEGTAQFQREWMDYDRWDSHRDMLLRTQILEGSELSLNDMGGFYSHTSLMRESVYNHGFAFSQYLADRFGEDGLKDLSAELGNWPNWNFKQAAKDAFGIRGEELYLDWMNELRTHYEDHAPEASDGFSYVEEDGFNNFYARVSPDGTKLAYLSNKGGDFSRTGIWVQDLTDGSQAMLAIPQVELGNGLSFTCSQGHKIVSSASGPIDWMADGRLVYSKTKDTSDGRLILDIYAMNLDTKEKEQLTENARAFSPAVSADGTRLAFVTHDDGSTNLNVLNLEDKITVALTQFADGSQVIEPVWTPDDEWIYFGLSRGHGRDIYRIRSEGGEPEAVLNEKWDERTPTFDSNGDLVFASDRSGIFNLYRSNANGDVALTAEQGGAFMAEYAPDGTVYFSRYEGSGYKIVSSSGLEEASPQAYQAPSILSKSVQTSTNDAFRSALNNRDDSGIRAFTPAEMDSVDGYSPVFTSMSFLPVLRLDKYVSRKRSRTDVRIKDRTRAETLWRNTKLGFYTATREVLGGLSFFGGVLIGPGSGEANSFGDFLSPSSLLDLERDVFIQVDYARGLPFINKRWAPQFSAQLFNVRRNVENGLSIEEFPCTSCYPDTTLADLAYNLWEVDLMAKSKIARWLMLDAGYRYSPYRVTTKRFFSKELNQGIPPSSSRYYIGRAFHSRLIFESYFSHRDMNVVPHGLRAELSVERETGRLLNRFDLEDGVLSPVYEESTVRRVSFSAKGGMKLGGWPGKGIHGVNFRMRASTILGAEKDDFYNDYVGGLTGARGYPFYALGGNETLWLQAGYTFPIFPRIKKQFLFTYIDKMYLKLYGDAAWAWSGSWPGMSNARKDVGAEVRFGLGSYYLLPTALFISATYGLDAFDFQLDEGFVTPDGATSVRYGESWQWHLGILFDFDQL